MSHLCLSTVGTEHALGLCAIYREHRSDHAMTRSELCSLLIALESRRAQCLGPLRRYDFLGGFLGTTCEKAGSGSLFVPELPELRLQVLARLYRASVCEVIAALLHQEILAPLWSQTDSYAQLYAREHLFYESGQRYPPLRPMGPHRETIAQGAVRVREETRTEGWHVRADGRMAENRDKSLRFYFSTRGLRFTLDRHPRFWKRGLGKVVDPRYRSLSDLEAMIYGKKV